MRSTSAVDMRIHAVSAPTIAGGGGAAAAGAASWSAAMSRAAELRTDETTGELRVKCGDGRAEVRRRCSGVEATRARQVREPGGHARVLARSGLARSPTGALTLLRIAIGISAIERHKGHATGAGVNTAEDIQQNMHRQESKLHFLSVFGSISGPRRAFDAKSAAHAAY